VYASQLPLTATVQRAYGQPVMSGPLLRPGMDALTGNCQGGMMTANPAADETRCPQASDGYHCSHWQKGTGRCCACGQNSSEASG